ncbi:MULTISPECIES: hypothetical protein [Methanohalophilus]|uniref:Uncharacterized protein n=2 Tax=Methanohalophilus euhalobius TaxID=51203 RepID=A0A285G0P3_9EURY|nr:MULTISPECIES: hypothetical protein [Methanohalophilus]TCL11934.1 hypothetical protein C7960_1141 [Methanohalophilus euhalobius]SNY17085.1 hypothetical protein SAMN06295989_10711 [Methanohalophilus euhalobius]
MPQMDLYTFIECLANIDKSRLHYTAHFIKRWEARLSYYFSEIEDIYDVIANQTPVGIIIQDEGKFKVHYTIDVVYDLIIVLSIKRLNPFEISLVTSYKQRANRRVREDEKSD